MHRFYLPPEQCRADRLALGGAEAHHARDVLRIEPGERVTVLDGAGLELVCEVLNASRQTLTLAVRQRLHHPPAPCAVTLLQALPKGKTMDFIVQKATELGTARIVPLLAERSIVHLATSEFADKVQKWRQTAIEAMKQCGAAWLPQIELPVTPAAAPARRELGELSLVGSLQPDALHPRVYFETFAAAHHRRPAAVTLWIGPEGDFTPAELAAIRASGVLPISLGPRVLRCDTAALYCLSVVSSECQWAPTALRSS